MADVEAHIKLQALEKENTHLKSVIADLERKLGVLTSHPTLAAGIAGESIVAKIVNGVVTAYAGAFDVTAASGAKIEVKYSKLNIKYKERDDTRWAWGKIFGEGGSKVFDYLLLVGDADKRHARHYRDSDSSFVMFCLPFAEVAKFTMSMNSGRYRAIQLTSSPTQTTRSSRAKSLFDEFQVTAPELKARFGI
jgi:hypothetical protein